MLRLLLPIAGYYKSGIFAAQMKVLSIFYFLLII
jgi:hypothetical protein